MKKILSLFTLILLVQWTFAVDPSTNLATYYANIDGKATDSNDNLRKTLCTIISNGYTTIGYSSLPNSVYAASRNPSDFYNGSGSSKTMEDIYSSYPYNSSQDGSSATTCGTGWNKEHTVPQSWFGKASPMVSDAHHVFPTDIRMNSCRSNYPYGENNASKYCSSYGYGHLGTSTFSGYTGQVFDPGSKEDCGGNCYRGDLARVYFYMATRYRTTNFTNGTGGTSFTYTNGVADLTDYMKKLMLKWHREDPVSEKELIRNNAIYAHQGNRNPFVDYPCLAEYIWGDKKGEAVSLSSLISGYVGVGTDCCSSEPTLTVSSSSITIGPIATSSSTTQTFTVTGANLTGSISITKNSGSSSYITVSPTSITSGYNGTNPITITYNAPASAGTHTATLTISSTGATPVTVNITASCAASCTATWMADGSQVGTSYAASGTRPDVPASNPTNCSASRVFVGWTATSGYSGNSAPGDLFTTTAPTITTDKTFYAVYADKTEGASGKATFTASDISSTPSAGTNTWTHTASGITLSLSAGQRYTSGTPNTFTVTKGTSNYAQLSGDKTITQVVATISGGNYKINSATPGSLTTSGITQTISNINSTSVKMTATTDYQIRLTQLEVTYTSVSYDNYSTQCTASSCTLSSITLNTSSVQKSFAVGDAFNYTGLIVTANYSDCENKTVTPTSVSSPDMSTTGDKTVTVSYIESGTTKTATYTITVEAAPEYTVTFMNMGGTHATRTGTAGSAISAVSDPTACTGYTFEGWSTLQYAVDNTGTPSLSTPTTIPVGGATYYAVYSKTEGSGGSGAPVVTYEKVTTALSNWAGNYLIVYETESKVFNGLSSTGSYVTTTISDGVIAHTDVLEACEVVIAKMTGDNYSIQMNSSATNNASKYLSGTSGSNKMNFDNSASANTIELSSGDVTITSNTSVWRFNNASSNGDMFRYYKSTSYSNQQPIQIYVRTETGGGSSTIYHTTAPDCSCTATITATSNDDSMGTISVTIP